MLAGGTAVTKTMEKTAHYLCRKLWSITVNTYCIPQGEETKETWGRINTAPVLRQ